MIEKLLEELPAYKHIEDEPFRAFLSLCQGIDGSWTAAYMIHSTGQCYYPGEGKTLYNALLDLQTKLKNGEI